MGKLVLTLAILMLVGCVPVSISFGPPATATPIPTLEPTATATATATTTPDATATAQAVATSTAQAQATANVLASATVNAQASATAQARASATTAAATAQANATATTLAAAAATRTAFMAYVDALTKKAGKPNSFPNGKLESNAKVFSTNLTLTNFVADVEFANPADPKIHTWDFMFQFRFASLDKWYGLVLYSNGTYSLLMPGQRQADRTTTERIAAGNLPMLNLSPTGSNRVRLVVSGGTAFLIVNGELGAVMDVSSHISSGELWISSGRMIGDDFPGLSLSYKDLVVSSLP